MKVPLYLAPVLVDRDNQRFRILDSEGIDSREVSPADSCAFKSLSGICMIRMIAVAELLSRESQ